MKKVTKPRHLYNIISSKIMDGYEILRESIMMMKKQNHEL